MKKGFSLVEFLVYLGLTSIFSLVLFRSIASSISQLTLAAQQAQQVVDMALAYDVFTRDVMRAPRVPTAWKKIDEHELIWSQGDITIGWCWKKDKLIRTTGSYDVSRAIWRKATRSCVACTKQPFSFVVNGLPREVASVALQHEQSETRTVMVRNGVRL